MKTNLKTPEYQPGVCNIGGAEAHRRKISGYIGAVFSIAYFVACISFHAPRGIRAIIFIPLVVASTGWLQSRMKFCVAFGLMGVFNFGSLGQASRIVDNEQRSIDRRRALVMLAQAAAFSAVFALVLTLIPA